MRDRRLLVLLAGLAVLAALVCGGRTTQAAPVRLAAATPAAPLGTLANAAAPTPAVPIAETEKLTVPHGRLERIGKGPNAIDVIYLDGTPRQMGFAQGRLLGDKIRKFYGTTIPGMAAGMNVSMHKVDEAWAKMAPYVSRDMKEEMQGLAAGAGVSIKMVQRAHTIPDLSEFHCTFFGAWGKATTTGHLIQIRALDYATEAGIQNYRCIQVYKPRGKIPFVTVGWTGMLGCLTGINAQGIAVSEIGDSFGNEKETLSGIPMPFLLREVLERSHNVEEATKIIQQAHRTSSFLYCVGDGKVPTARAFMTCKDWAYVFDPHSLPNRQLDDVVYFSMGADSAWNDKVYDVLKGKYGKIDPNVAMQDVMKGLGTGDLHAVAWDVTAMKMWVANCTVAPLGTKGKPAYDQEFVPFDVGAALGLHNKVAEK